MIITSRSGFRDQGHGVSCPVLANGSGKGSCLLGCFHWWLFPSIRECWAGVRATGGSAWIWRDSGLKPDFVFLVVGTHPLRCWCCLHRTPERGSCGACPPAASRLGRAGCCIAGAPDPLQKTPTRRMPALKIETARSCIQSSPKLS